MEKLKQDHQKRMESARGAFSNMAAKIKAKTKIRGKRPIQRKKFKNRIDSAKEDLAAFAEKLKVKNNQKEASTSGQSRLDAAKEGFSFFAAKLKVQRKGKPKHVTEKFCTLRLEITGCVQVEIVDEDNDKVVFSAKLGEAVPDNTEFSVQSCGDLLTVQYSGYGDLSITHLMLDDSHCYLVEWTLNDNGCLQDSANMSHAHWFGGSISHEQTWPITWQHKLAPFVSWDTRYDPVGYGSVLERYWLSSTGVAIYVDSDVPLFVAVNDNDNQQLTLVSKFEKPYKNLFAYNVTLKYTIIQSADMRIAHDLICKEFFLNSEGVPAPEMFQLPVWTTTACFGQEVSEEKLLQYMNDIVTHMLEPGIIEFGDDWTPAYGDMVFDPKRFPNSKTLLKCFKSQGFKIVVWVHPFASPRSKAFYEGDNLWVKSSLIEGVTAWKHGPAKLLDVTNPYSCAWLERNLLYLREEYGIDGFFFDGGQANFLPSLANTSEPLSDPDGFGRSYVEFANDMMFEERFSMVAAGVGTQNVPLMICLSDKNTSWGSDNGLLTVIPTMLTLGIMGYPFVMPGTVGGRTARKRPGSELYIRWLETVILMPAIKLSYPPWEYGEDTLCKVLSLMAIRQSFMEYILGVARQSQETCAPMVRPLWWRAPTDDITYTIDSEYMVGDELLVAPILDKGMNHRSIYLPAGVWRDELRGATVQGKRWLYSYRAKLGELPHFTLLNENQDDVEMHVEQ